MAKLTNNTRTVEITMRTWTGENWSPDLSDDFFEGAHRDQQGALVVEDVEYCIDMARDWETRKGDYYDDDPEEERRVEVAEVN